MLESYLSLLSSHFHSEGLIKRSGERVTVYGPLSCRSNSYSLSTESEMDGMLSNLNSNIDYNNEIARADSATQGMSLSSNIISQDDIPLIITTRKAFRARQSRMSQIGSLLQSSVYVPQSSHGPDCSYIKKKKKGIILYSSSITDGVICGDNDGCSEKNKASVMPFATVGISLLCGTTSTLDLAKLLRLRRVSNNNGNTNTNYCSVKCTPSPQQSPRPSPNPVLSSPVLSPSVKENVNPQEEDPTSDSQTQQCLTATNKTKTSITHSKSQSDALIDSSDKSKGAKDTSVYSDSEPLHTNTEIENSVCRGGDKINEQKFVDGKCVVEHDMSKGTPRSIRPQRSIAMIGDKRERSSEDNADLNSIDIHKRPHADDADSTAFVTMSISKGSSPNGHCCDAAKDGAVDVDIPPAARPYRHTATNNSSHKLHMDTSLDVMSTPPPSSPASVWSASSTRSMQMVIDQEKWLRKEKELRLNQRAIRCLFSSDISREVESDIIVSDDEGAMLGDVRCFNAIESRTYRSPLPPCGNLISKEKEAIQALLGKKGEITPLLNRSPITAGDPELLLSHTKTSHIRTDKDITTRLSLSGGTGCKRKRQFTSLKRMGEALNYYQQDCDRPAAGDRYSPFDDENLLRRLREDNLDSSIKLMFSDSDNGD